MITVHLQCPNKTETVYLPEGWNELTAKQLTDIAKSFLSKAEPETQLTNIIVAITGMSRSTCKQMDAEVMRNEIFPLISWLQEDDLLTKQLFPIIRCGQFSFYGPADELGNIRLAEFDFAERELYWWYENQDATHLYNFIACLYRLPVYDYDFAMDPEGDCRMPFNYNIAMKQAPILQHYLQPDEAFAIVLFYKGCRAKITRDHPRIFDGGGDAAAPDAPMYYGLMRSIAKTGIYGNFEAVEQMFLSNALVEMEMVLDEREEIEKLKNQKEE